MNKNIESLYDYTLQQMAAESYFEGVSLSDTETIKQRLILGTNRDGDPKFKTSNSDLNEGYPGYTRMTTAQADEFMSKFSIIHQWSDNPTPTGSRPAAEGLATYDQLNDEILANTGLSATLIQDKGTGEFTLAIRSTEFRDWEDGGDGERDKAGADVSSIAFTGFALAQQDALEHYYAWLKQNGKLPDGAKLNVTGYSLGGNLATVFTEMHKADGDIKFGETITFNGAGRGTFDSSAGSLKDMVDYYHATLLNPQYDATVGSAIGRFNSNYTIATYIAGQAFDATSLYDDARYKWAVAATKYKFGLTYQSWTNENRTGTTADSLITQVFGYETINNTNVTANSGIHAPAVRVGIESQPLVEGPAAGFIGTGDFGNGHSITLIADSLALQRALHGLDSGFTLEKFISILPNVTNRQPTNGINANYEVDALESILDGIRQTVLGSNIKETEFKEGASGFGDITNREIYQNNIKALTDSQAFKSLIGKVQIVAQPTSADAARADFGAFLSLVNFTPFALKPNDATSASILKNINSTNGELALQWAEDSVLTAEEIAQGEANYSAHWLADRAAMLGWIIKRNKENISSDYGIGPEATQDTMFYDAASGTTINLGSIADSADSRRRFMFGADNKNDMFTGGTSSDRLYGMDGDDTLTGNAGNDWLEGGAGADKLTGGEGADRLYGGADNDTIDGGLGNDTLVGGEGTDTYVIKIGEGTDTLLDADGTGVITIAGAQIKGRTGTDAKHWQAPAANTWLDTENNITYTRTVEGGETRLLIHRGDNNLIVRNWQEGGLGIVLGTAAEPTADPVTAGVIEGDHPVIDQNALAAGIQPGYDSLDNLKTDYGIDVERQDILHGDSGNNLIRGLANIDYLSGWSGDDILEGGEGNDVLAGGRGNDILRGAGGSDILLGDGYLNGYLGVTDPFTLTESGSLIAERTETTTNGVTEYDINISMDHAEDWVAGDDIIEGGAGDDHVRAGDGNDYVDGGDGADPLFGYGGKDIILGQAGNDVIVGDNLRVGAAYDDDYLSGGGDDDRVIGAGGNDYLSGGDGNDILVGDDVETQQSDGVDVLDGGDGADHLDGGGNDDLLLGGGGTDDLYGKEGNDALYGGADADYLDGDLGDDTLDGGDGADQLFGVEGNDVLEGGTGDDYLDGGDGIDTLDGGIGADTLFGGAADDTLDGGEGDDGLIGDEGNDTLNGGSGADTLWGMEGNDTLSGGAGNDHLEGREGDDYLDGGEGVDELLGGAGNDTLVGSADDILDGGDGNDTYIIDGQTYVEIADSQGSNTIEVNNVSPTEDVQIGIDEQGAVLTVGPTKRPGARFYSSENSDNSANGSIIDHYTTIVIDGVVYIIPENLGSSLGSTNGKINGTGSIYGHGRSSQINDNFNGARAWFPSRDPLTLDLDGDGLETVGIDSANPILFDHDGDGLKNATGWIKPDDGFLVLDRNGNGSIDNGSELFGDSTPLYIGGKAADGFAALAQEDINGDGLVNASDANFADLRIWQDANSDGLTDAGELRTLEELGIAGLHVTKIENTTRLANGNQIADLGSYIKTDGTEGTLGNVTGGMADIDLADNPFFREFADTVPLTEEAMALPDMQASGSVRDLREAASLSAEMATAVAAYAAADTRAEQLARADNVIRTWAETSAAKTSVEQAEDQGYHLVYLIPGLTASEFLLGEAGSQQHAQQMAQQAQIAQMLGVLEMFNGLTFVNVSHEGVRTGTNQFITATAIGADGDENSRYAFVSLSNNQIDFFNRSYAALKQTIYDGLLPQTRLKPYLDNLDFTVTLTGANPGMDFTGMDTAFQARYGQAPAEAVRDLLDLQRMMGNNLTGLGWDGYGQLRGWLATAVASANSALVSSLAGALADFGYSGLTTAATDSSEVVIGADSGAVLNGNGGNDLVLGGNGDDILNGGIGSDILGGGAGNDTYVFNLGDGSDTIIGTRGAEGTDTLQFGAGIYAGNLNISRDGDKLVFSHINGKDTVAIANWFNSVGVGNTHWLDAVRFADGRVLDLRTLQLGTDSADTLTGTVVNDVLGGGAGMDTLNGAAGDDWLDGGAGADIMAGGDGNDIYVVDNVGDTVVETEDGDIDTVHARASATLAVHVENLRLVGTASINGLGNGLDNAIIGNDAGNALYGMAGDDTLTSNGGNDLLDGGTGADLMAGGTGDDSYVVDTLADTVIELAGQGQDTIYTGLNYTLGANVENLTLTGVGAVNGTGNELNNLIIGNSAANALTGQAGNDTLNGGGGADTMLGGAGNDIYVVDDAGDLVIENAGEGTDLVQSSIGYTLTNNVENLALTGVANSDGTGNALDNTINGNIGANVLTGLGGSDWLDGGLGADTMVGGTGDDTYVVDQAGDAVVEAAGEGTDTVRSAIGYTLGANVENLVLIGGASIDGAGNELDNAIAGNGGNNLLDGGLGADSMAGGYGNDTYVLDNTGDTVTESTNAGNDTVIAPFDYTLGANVDNLVLTGPALTGTGNTLDNTIIGTTANNTLTGLGGKDTLDGGVGADTLIGGTGDDTYVVDSLADATVEQAGEGVDTVQASLTWTLADNVENLTLTGLGAIDGTGNVLDNIIVGNNAANTLTGLAGNDTLNGGAGADAMLGGAGNDIYIVDDSGDFVVEDADEGSDTVKSSVTHALTDNVENLTLTGAANIDGTGNVLDNVLLGNSGSNILIGQGGNDTLNGGGGADTLIGGTGGDIYVVDNAGDTVVEDVDAGTDTVQSGVSYALGDNVEHLTLTGTGNINATGNALDNTLAGNNGANVLDGGAGGDSMAGGAGNDTYVVDNVGDLITENAGAGTDTALSGIDYTLTANTENLTLTGNADLDGTGNELANTIKGNSGNNVLLGLAGNDTMAGNDGNDLLDGGSGADAMTGGTGDDIYVVDNIGDTVTEVAGAGTDKVRSSISYTLGAYVEKLALTGAGDVSGTGNELNNALLGNSGNNLLDGGVGADMMSGGAGSDTYVIDNSGDAVVEAANEGIDTVRSSVSHTLAENVENLILTELPEDSSESADLNAIGNVLDNTLVGNSGNNLLDGGAGADNLAGGAGDDTYIVDNSVDAVTEYAGEGMDTIFASASHALSDNIENLILTGGGDISGTGNALSNTIIANAGINTLAGGGGDDIYQVNDTADAVIENAGEGVDTVHASATFTLSDNVESLILTGTASIDGTGSAQNNTLTGNSGDNILDGGAGADQMAGSGGNDTYIVDNAGDVVTENAGEGTDTVVSSVSYTLAGNVESMTLSGAADIDATGNTLDNVLLGNAGNNKLFGLAGNDTLTGNQGNDLLDGGTGNDAMGGSAGNDTYVVDSVGDVVVENADEGNDTVQSSITHTLADNVENLTLTGTAAINGTGNVLDNAVTGNSGNNVLDGGAGVDTMTGGAGNDTYVVDNTADVVVESLNAGTDTVLASATYTLSANVENLTLTGIGDINGTGNALANVITANSGLNVLAGGAGNDTYVVDNTADVVVENANEGTDLVQSLATYTLSANVENLTLTGTANIDGTGNALANTIVGNSGNNVIDGGVGADNLSGGTGNDTYIVDNTGDLVTEAASAGTDLVYSSVNYTLTANVENLTLTGTSNINGTGNTLNNIILGNNGNNVLDGSSGADSMAGGVGNDTYVVDNTADVVTELADEGTDLVQSSVTYTLSANVENLTLTGTAAINGTGNTLDNIIIGNTGNNVLSGLAGNDTLTGNAGNDTLDGGIGADTMAAGAGNDTYVVDDAGDLVTENLNEGTDLVQSSITYTLTNNVENLTLTGTANIDGTGNTLANVITGNSGANLIDGGAGDDTIAAGAGNDTLTGGDGNDTLSGEAGSDTISGNAGNDTLNGGLDADIMYGGVGNDTYVVDNIGDLVVENVAEGTDLVQSSITYTLTDNVENLTLTGTAAINGTGNVLNNVVIGNSAANTLFGLEGDDTLDGSGGADTLMGSVGNDTYVVDNAGDVVTELADEGTDLVQSSVTYTLSANVENLTLTGTAAINGTGNTLDNIIIGNTGNNVLSGLAGNDTLTGNAGNDTLDGGIGADTMAAGAGNDTYVVDDAGDLVTENLNEGTDLVQSSITYTLTNNVENLTLTGTANIDGTGNTLANVITGNSGANLIDGGAGDDTLTAGAGDDTLLGGIGNDTLDGGLGADTMTGGVGNDTYVVDNVGDLVTESLNEGTDLVQSSITYTLTDNVENLTLTGTANINGTGNVLANVITGNSGSNTLYGLEGNDTLNGGAGADTLMGGTDNDTYVVDNIGDVIVEATDEGTDLVQSSVTYTLASNVENLTLTGTANINGTGNELNNVIVGNSGNNVLSGLAGNDTLTGNAGNDTLDGGLDADTMAGNAGNDTYVVDNVGDVVTENANEGTDLVQSSRSYTLGANVENLTLTGTADLNGTGNTLANVITGNAGNNVLDGGSGADTLVGGAGNDTYIVDNTGDVITEAAASGTDVALSSVTYTLSANVENLTLTGAATINGTGNTLDNVIIGNGAANTLTGDLGNDTLDGGAGADTLVGGAGNDTYIVDNSGDVVTEAANAGTDTVQSSVNYTLTANVENLVLTGAALNGTGNVLNNAVTGTSGNNVLDGGAGADTLIGGNGNDTYVVDNSADSAVENAGEGTDTVQASANYVLASNVENLTLTGTADLSATGNELDNVITGNGGNNVLAGMAGNDTLVGNAGNDVLDGGTGADVMAGGLGNDTYVVDDAGDTITENAGDGTDTVQSSLSYALADSLENLTLTGSAALVGTGNAGANVLTCNAGDNVLYGLSGNDTLVGNSGNDLLDGGTEADQMAGGAGNDTYIVDNSGDVVTEAANAGTDTVQSSVNYTLTANVENLVLTGAALNGTGNVLNNAVTGTSGNNVLDGGAGADTLIGGTGNDTYMVDNSADSIVENAGEGTDTVLASASYALSDDIENLTLTGSANINATGNVLDNVITSNAGVNALAGLGGDDTYIVNDSTDIVTENAGDGIDTVQASASYTLSDNVENLTLTGAAINGTGNALDNVILGNAAGNMLDGGAGADMLAGGQGDDVYVVDDANDAVTELVGEGMDTVRASISYSLGDNVENLALVGTANIDGTGNALNNTLTGNGGDNVLDGGAGADAMAGGIGNDTYLVDNAGDVVTESLGEGNDTVLSSISYGLGTNLENLTLTGSANLNGTGNDLDNAIIGNLGNNMLDGGAGNDTLDGGAGADLLMGGAGDDGYVFRLGSGADEISDAQGSDTLYIGSGLNEFNLEAERVGDDLLIHIIGTEDFVTLDNWYGQSEGVNHIVFSDGATLDRTGIDALRNRPPVANADTISVAEDGGAYTFPVTYLLANDTDPNAGDTLSVVAIGTSQMGASVSLAGGQITYDIGNAFQQLAQGEVIHDTFSYTITDSKGAQSSSLVNVDIVGTNDASVTAGDVGATTEDATLPITGNVLANDHDIDNGTIISISSFGSYVGTYGTLLLGADGSYSYSLNNDSNAVQGLAQDQVAVDHFAYNVTDGIASVASSLDISVTGVNDAPVVSADAGAVSEDGTLTYSGSVLANDHDVDVGAVLSVASPGEYTGTYGKLIISANGSYTYSLNNDSKTVQSLPGGTAAIDHFAYSATDGITSTLSGLDITVGGANDAPVTAADQALIVEDWGTSVSGNLLANDYDVDNGSVLQIAAPGSFSGAYGTLSVQANGDYTYNLNNAAASVQSLGRDALAIEHFGYTATDGQVGTANVLDVFLHGTNDAPILVKPLADQEFTFNKPFYWQMPSGSFADVDQGDKLTYSATLADGSALPDWLRFDAATQAFSGVSPKAELSIGVRVTATDQVAATGSEDGSLIASDVFQLTISHGNEGVGNGEDAAPAGHASNTNDGTGTSTGNPGSKTKTSSTSSSGGGGTTSPSGTNTATPSTAPTTNTTTDNGSQAQHDLAANLQTLQKLPSYLGDTQWAKQYITPDGSTDAATVFARWLQMDEALAKALASNDGLPWADGQGVDTTVLNQATSGYLGSTIAFGKDSLSLLNSTGQNLQVLSGLNEGVQRIA